jgi:outer membrane receptor protein involved in Fe transport
LIRYRRTSLNAVSPYNVGEARITGVEAAARSEWFGRFSTDTAVTLLDPRDTQRSGARGNDVLPLLSRLVVSQGLDAYTAWQEANARRIVLGIRYYYRSNRYVDPVGLETLPSLQLWDAHASWRFDNPDVEVSASVNNMFNVLSLDTIGLPLAGRVGHVALTAWW